MRFSGFTCWRSVRSSADVVRTEDACEGVCVFAQSGVGGYLDRDDSVASATMGTGEATTGMVPVVP